MNLWKFIKKIPFQKFSFDGKIYTKKQFDTKQPLIIKIERLSGANRVVEYFKIYFKKSKIKVVGKYNFVYIHTKILNLDNLFYSFLKMAPFKRDDIEKLIEKHNFNPIIFEKNIKRDLNLTPVINYKGNKIYIKVDVDNYNKLLNYLIDYKNEFNGLSNKEIIISTTIDK